MLMKQLRGTYENLKDTAIEASPDRIVPPAIWGTVEWLLKIVPQAFGFVGTANDQFLASAVLILFSIVATPFTLGYSLALAAVFVLTLIFSVFRHVPAVEEQYTWIQRPLRTTWLSFKDLVFGW